MLNPVAPDRARGLVRSALLVAYLVVAATVVAPLASADGATKHGSFTVRSTLAGMTVLPHRIRWLGLPSLPPDQIKEVDFSIDGKLRWREQRAPYTYANDGNYLVTSWLSPGVHRFTVDTLAIGNRRATVTTQARVAPAPPTPAALAGAWQRILTKAEVEGAIDSPPGRWRLTIDRTGWRFRDPGTHGALIDVAYVGARIVEARSGIATQLPGPGTEGNLWCDSPSEPVRYRWVVDADTLWLTLAGPKRCDGQSQVWAGEWTRT